MSGSLRVHFGGRVAIRFEARLETGEVFDQTRGQESMEFVVGSSEILIGLNRALLGMRPGEKKSFEVFPENGFGTYRKNRWISVDRIGLPNNLQVGDALADHLNPGRVLWVRELKEHYAILDLNHPLAGKTLFFDVEVLRFTESTSPDHRSSSLLDLQSAKAPLEEKTHDRVNNS